MGDRELTLRQARDLCLQFGDMYRQRHSIPVQAYAAGMSRKEIAAKMGLSRQAVTAAIAATSARPGNSSQPPLAGPGPGRKRARRTSPPPGPELIH